MLVDASARSRSRKPSGARTSILKIATAAFGVMAALLAGNREGQAERRAASPPSSRAAAGARLPLVVARARMHRGRSEAERVPHAAVEGAHGRFVRGEVTDGGERVQKVQLSATTAVNDGPDLRGGVCE